MFDAILSLSSFSLRATIGLMKPKRYCYREVTYPQEAYIGYVTILKGEDILLFYPLDPIFSTFEEYQYSVKQFTKQFSVTDLAVSDTGLLMPITFMNHFPLKQDYWQKPTVAYSTEQRVKLFGSAANLYDMYKVLITPSILAGKRPMLHAAIPFFLSATHPNMEAFMYTSDFPVDETAKNAGIYKMEKPFAINWVSGEVVRQKDVEKLWETH